MMMMAGTEEASRRRDLAVETVLCLTLSPQIEIIIILATGRHAKLSLDIDSGSLAEDLYKGRATEEEVLLIHTKELIQRDDKK